MIDDSSKSLAEAILVIESHPQLLKFNRINAKTLFFGKEDGL